MMITDDFISPGGGIAHGMGRSTHTTSLDESQR